MKKAIILCSGGLDSVITAHFTRKKYDSGQILFFNYGQNSLEIERECSQKCAEHLGYSFKEITLELDKDLMVFPLVSGKEVTHGADLKDTKEETSQWYVPMRNLIFLSQAIALAEVEKADVYVGFKDEGAENYPDTTKEFVDALNSVVCAADLKDVRIVAPLLEMDKEDIVLLGEQLGVNFKETYSCYVGKKTHCGKCLACRLRKAGFYWSNVKDPTEYGD